MTALVVNAAAILLESTPFILAGAICLRLRLPLRGRLVSLVGCGCGWGPSALSLPATAATWVAFGPAVALARFGAAFAIERLRSRRHNTWMRPSTLQQLHEVLLPALLGAAVVPYLPAVAGFHAPAPAIFVLAALTGFAAAPCALGATGIASVLRAYAPAAAAGFLCVAGLVDLRTWKRYHASANAHDVLAYSLAACSCALIALRGGAGFVNPKIAFTLWPCAGLLAWLAYVHRREARPALRLAPAIMLAGCVLAAPSPVYFATQSTLADAFAGERIDFTGNLVRTGNADFLVRYAITCCRADAAPIAVRLEAASSRMAGWYRARGILVSRSDGLRLRADTIRSVDRPADVFVYL